MQKRASKNPTILKNIDYLDRLEALHLSTLLNGKNENFKTKKETSCRSVFTRFMPINGVILVFMFLPVFFLTLI